MNLATVRAIQVRSSGAEEIQDRVAVEGKFRLFLNGTLFSELVASGEQLAELGAGFVVCQGLAGEVEEVTADGQDIRVTALIDGGLVREIISTGAVGTRRPFRPVRTDLTLTPGEVFSITREIETDAWRQTGGVHCSVLFHEHALQVKSSDVGRHNTVDKVIGHAVLRGLDRSRCVLGCTGRQPRDMVAKAAHAGIPVVISRAASTDLGIAAAREAGITLVCFSRGDRFTIYSHPERILGEDAELGGVKEAK
jgi:FdhD protein